MDCAASARWGTLSCAPAWPLSAPSVVLPPTSPPRNATAAASATAAAVAAARADVTSRRGASSPRVCSSVYTDDVFNTFDAGGGTHPTGPVPMSAWWNPTTLLPRADAAAFPASAAVADCAAAACYACFCSSLGLVAGSDGGPSGDAAFCSSWLAASARRWGAKAGCVIVNLKPLKPLNHAHILTLSFRFDSQVSGHGCGGQRDTAAPRAAPRVLLPPHVRRARPRVAGGRPAGGHLLQHARRHAARVCRPARLVRDDHRIRRSVLRHVCGLVCARGHLAAGRHACPSRARGACLYARKGAAAGA